VNERYGQALGDAVLQAAALRLSKAVRSDDAVFRIGGNKFAILASAMDRQTMRWLAMRVSQTLANTFRYGALEVELTPAVGAACAKQTEGADGLCRAAELARQRSEQEGFVPIMYEEALGRAVEERHQLREALAGAIAADEFRLVWQPQFDTRAHRLVGAEGLIRWNCAALGREVTPGELFPIAISLSLLADIDAWVLDEALATKRRWAGRAGAPPVIAINITGTTLRDLTFADRVREALQRHGVAARELEIEIPEDVPARDLDALAQTLDALCALGVRLSLDDFGGGASSMAHLVQLPVDRVKLDRTIVRGLPGGLRESAILGAVIALAHSLEIEVLAEGVENEAQTLALQGQGCTVVQGWLYGRPVPADVLVPMAADP
jgi:EAL domain-containing protein (putative c-di-GMP-specific phosphodiesterase class I)